MRFFSLLACHHQRVKEKLWKVRTQDVISNVVEFDRPVNVVLNKTVVVDSDWRFDSLWGGHLQSHKKGKFAIFSTKEVCNVKKEALPMFS